MLRTVSVCRRAFRERGHGGEWAAVDNESGGWIVPGGEQGFGTMAFRSTPEPGAMAICQHRTVLLR